MPSWIVQLPANIDFKTRVKKTIEATKKNIFFDLYIKAIPSIESDKQLWVYIYQPLIFPLQWYIILSAFGSSLFFGFHKLFWVLITIACVFGFFRSKYFPMIILYIKCKKDYIKFI